MKTTLGRRWLALLLTLALCLTLAPAVLAGGEAATNDLVIQRKIGDTFTPPGEDTDSSFTVPAGESIDFEVLAFYGETELWAASGAEYKWTSTGDGIVTLSGGDNRENTVTGETAGVSTVTVSVTWTDSTSQVTHTGSRSFTVTVVEITGLRVTLSPTSMTVVTKETGKELKATAAPVWSDGKTRNFPTGSSVTFNWTGGSAVSLSPSGNSTVTASGGTATGTSTVSGAAEGSATVTVKASYTSAGNKTVTDSKTCSVTVEDKMSGVGLSTDSITMDVGDYQTVTATPVPSDAKVTWHSSDAEAVDAGSTDPTGQTGTIHGLRPGRSTVTATIGSEPNRAVSPNLDVTVSGILLSQTSLTVAENGTEPLPTAERFGNAANGNLNWQSSNPNVAQISGSNVAGRAPGDTTITVYAGSYFASFNVHVSTDSSTTIGPLSLRSTQTLSFSDYRGDFNRQSKDDTLSHLTGVYVDPSQGTLYYNYTSSDEPNEGVAQRENYYYSPGSGQKDLRNITFVPNPQFEGGQVTITYTVVSKAYQNYNCRFIINVDPSEAGTISLSASNTTPARFNGNTFERLCKQETGSSLDYVIFSLPPENKGVLYADYVNAGNYGSKVSSGAMYSKADLDNVVFVPAAGVPANGRSEDVTVYYTARGAGTNGRTYSGKVIINVTRENVAGSGGPVYNISKGATQTLDDSDFNDYCGGQLGLNTLSYIRFDSLPASTRGSLYHSYRSATSTGTPVQAGTNYYYGTRNPRLDRITFVPAEGFTGSVRIPFTGWDTAGNRFSGNLEINVQGSGGTGSIRYSCIPGRTVNFTLSDFTSLSRDLTDRTLSYIVFQDLPNRATEGSIYHNNTRVSATGTRYYNTSGSYRIKNLSFHAASGFTGSVDIPFIGYTSSSGVTFNGVLTIDSSGGAYGDTTINYYTDYSTAAVFERDDFNEISLEETGYSISSVKFSVPGASRGDLYRSYRSATSKGTRISSSSTSISSSGLDQVAFVPASGFVGTVYIDYTATAASGGGTFTGTVEIEVEQPGADVTVRYGTRTAPVDFQGDDFRRSGYTLTSIKFNALPSASQGKLYYQYDSPTQYTRLAATGTTYYRTGTTGGLISDLTFVPRAGFTGTVTLPYTGTNSNKTTFDGQVVITVSPTTSSTRFVDLGGYSDQQRGSVEYIYNSGITIGISENQYGPELAITRGDFALMVYRAFGFTPGGNSWVFNDVPPDAYYAQAVNTLYAKGIVSGVGGGDYAPTASVSRQDAICMVQRAMQAVGWGARDGAQSVLSGYSDGGSVAGYAQGAMALAAQQGYLPLSGQDLAPRQNLTRIDMAQVLHRVLTY